MTRILMLLMASITAAACAVRLGGSKPEDYAVLAIDAPAEATAEEIAGIITGASASMVLLTSPQDTAWFNDVSTRTGLALSGPGMTAAPAKAFLTNLEILGDTSLVLGVPDGSRLHLHDALYQIGEDRLIDLMLFGVSERSDLREVARTMLSYIASDVGANAAVVMAVHTATPQAADSLRILLRAAYSTAGECAGDTGAGRSGLVRLFYGPSARVRCSAARPVEGVGSPILAELRVGR